MVRPVTILTALRGHGALRHLESHLAVEFTVSQLLPAISCAVLPAYFTTLDDVSSMTDLHSASGRRNNRQHDQVLEALLSEELCELTGEDIDIEPAEI